MKNRPALDDATFDSFRNSPELATLAAEILRLAGRAFENTKTYLAAVLPRIMVACDSDLVAVAAPMGGQWETIALSGQPESLPNQLLADVIDRETADSDGNWIATPLAPHVSDEALVVRRKSEAKLLSVLDTVTAIAPILHDGLSTVRERQRERGRIGRLEAILEIIQQWNRTNEVEPLLIQMAETATRLFEADRASIFLWDRGTHVLVGRPALGVEEGELRIPDNRGVVGQVIQTGLPRRVDAVTEPEEIDHQVDTKLGYRTESLLCVPLRGSSGELFGVFELINKRQGRFLAEDEAGLIELAAHAAIILENAQDRQQLLSTSRQMTEQAAGNVRLIGKSQAIESLRSILQRVADTELAVLILGENGTGKEVVAQSVHYLSRRREKPFIAVNCAAIPESLAESELFGHEKGAFTDAREARQGKFELAANGTFFLDEIGDLSLACQAKLLRVLEERVLVRVGGSTPIHTDARVVAATNQNLAEMVREKRFREDLYFRLNVVTLELPPLRERKEDILLLGKHFLEDFCKKSRRKSPKFTPDARKRLEEHAWPGNVRELRNLMERLAYLSNEDQIEAEELAFTLSPRGTDFTETYSDLSLNDATNEFQVLHIQRAIEQASGNMSQASRTLGLHRSNLYRKMRQLNMPTPG